MSQIISDLQSNLDPILSASASRSLRLSGEFSSSTGITGETQETPSARRVLWDVLIRGIARRWHRERRRRKVARAYDMALEIARLIPRGSEVLDVGCGNGFIAHHLSALLGTGVIGIDLGSVAEASIDFRSYDGERFPVPDNSFDAVTLCYVLHHAQNLGLVLNEMRRVLRRDGLAVIYEDIPLSKWDRLVCKFHNRQWQGRTGSCTFRLESEWRVLFEAFGFEIVSERQLSRARNLTHPVARELFVLKARSA